MSGLFDMPKPQHRTERVVVRPGELVAAGEFKGGEWISRELVDEHGNPCNSIGGPLPVAKPTKKGKK